MKKLTRMKLINWHRFENCTIDFDGSTLISGENGAGKSTLLDAIQFVVLCSASSFNKAAHDGGGRKLTGYIRCKSGRENQPYERTGQISAHVALEFYEESRDQYFIIGAVIDSASEGAEAKAWYLIDRARLSDERFFNGITGLPSGRGAGALAGSHAGFAPGRGGSAPAASDAAQADTVLAKRSVLNGESLTADAVRAGVPDKGGIRTRVSPGADAAQAGVPTPRSIAQFRAANKDIKQWCKTQAEARRMVKSRLGRLEDKFFRLIPKALAFKPIDDIKDFVYSYVLDAKEVRIDVLRENVRTYQELEATLASVRKRIERLEQIEKYHAEVVDCQRRDRMYAYYLTRVEADIAAQQAQEKEAQIRAEELRLESAEKERVSRTAERNRVQEMEVNLRVELREDKDYIALEDLKRQLEQLEHEEHVCRDDMKSLKAAVRRSLAQAEKLLTSEMFMQGEAVSASVVPESGSGKAMASDSVAGEGSTSSAGSLHAAAASGSGPAASSSSAAASKDILRKESPSASSDPEACLRTYRTLFSDVEKIDDVPLARDTLENVIVLKRAEYQKAQRALAEARIHLNQKEEEQRELKQRIADLERKKLTYPEGTDRLLGAIRSEFARLDRRSQPHVLCEVLEIADEEWRDAVEGYLNTQRFYILVEPDNYDIALGVYERLRRQKQVYGVGLINAEKLNQFDSAPEGTLAAKVETGNRYARRYVNMILGRVQLCDRVEDLKKYPVSITKECMRYQNRVASAIRPEVYNVPYIGKNAFRVQLAQAREKEAALKADIVRQKAAIREQELLTDNLSVEADTDVKYRMDVLVRTASVRSAIRQCREGIRQLEQNTTMIEKRIQLQELGEERRKLEAVVEKLIGDIGGLNASITYQRSELDQIKWQVTQCRSELTQAAEQAGEELSLWEKEYAKQTAGKSCEQFRANYERARKANDTSRQKAEDQMTACMIDYKTAHDFGAAAGMSGYPEFAAVYDRLVKSELLEYEEKVQAAREAAEIEFREQFLARLQENMKQAQGEFRDLNRALKDITFSNDRYEFLCMPGRRNRGFYEMIMDDFNIGGGQSLFSGPFYERYREVIDELFNRLAGRSETGEEILEEYTDYRTYMDYDIRILHGDGTYSLYSKVCEEKSGGETQTPFYVTVAASFVQLYGNSIGGEAAGLVMFDEAFNNMDDERIGGVLEFMNRLPLQIIISAPPEKIQYIAPKMSETLLIMTDEKVSYVEEYHVPAAH